MAIVQKENKQLTVDEKDVSTYLAQGYDLVDEEGNVKTEGKKKSVDYSIYAKVKAELAALKNKDKSVKK